jgi:glyoxylase-like metal-dependent hydrolase (beta-lactamase superfamily II)
MLNRITDDIFYTPNSSETDRPNLGYVRGTEAAVMIDSGNSPAQVREYLDALDAAGLTRPSYVFLTHHHWDHTFGLPYVDGDMISIAGTGTNAILREQQKYVWDEEHLNQYCADNRIPLFCKPHILLEYPDLGTIRIHTAKIEFDNELRIELGGETAVMRKITSGHTDECYYLLAEKAKILFIGDGDSEECVGTEWIDHKEPLQQSIRELEAIDFDYCLTGHSPLRTREELLTELKRRLALL